MGNGGKGNFAVYGSKTTNLFVFIIRLYAAVSTDSLALFGIVADAIVSVPYLTFLILHQLTKSQRDLVSSTLMLITSRMARRPKLPKYPIVSD